MPPKSSWVWLVEAAISEDHGSGDVTSLSVLPEGLEGSANIEARHARAVSGLEVAVETCDWLDVDCDLAAHEGAWVEAGTVLGTGHGSAVYILAAERVALNFLQRLSGIATLTHAYCEAVRGTNAEIVDTRKTTPGLRMLEKYAVRCGGGRNHRIGLYDGVLIKDNHIGAVGSVGEAVRRARDNGSFHLKICIEIESLEQAREAIEASADALLIDNQPPDIIRKVGELAEGRVRLEASGGVNLDTVAEIARTGVDQISVGALTHSAPAADIALEWNATSSS